MRTKKAIMGMFLVLGIVSIFAVNAFAEDAWYTCTISRVGGYTADGGSITVRLSDTKAQFPANTNFKIPEGRLNQILAVLSTAASNGAMVYVKADPVAKTLSAVFYNVE